MMPELFKNASDFDNWFNFDSKQKGGVIAKEQQMLVVQILHRILKPFMLRRTKADRVKKLPDKIEINISVGLSNVQLKLYQHFL